MVARFGKAGLLAFVLIASLGANFFLAGWIVGGHTANILRRPPRSRAVDENLRASLSEPGARIMTQAFDQVRQQFEAQFPNVRAARDRKAKLLDDGQFDLNAYETETKTERATMAADMAKADEIIAEAIAQLSTEDRRRLASMRLPGLLGGGPPFPRQKK